MESGWKSNYCIMIFLPLRSAGAGECVAMEIMNKCIYVLIHLRVYIYLLMYSFINLYIWVWTNEAAAI